MAPTDPTQTHRLFQHDRVAAGYASARPYLHPEGFARVRELVGPAARFDRALDVGCGTGLSSLALLDLAEAVVGIDAATHMLRHAGRAPGVRYVASGAEALPFREGSFDLVVACGSMDWVDRPRFLPAGGRSHPERGLARLPGLRRHGSLAGSPGPRALVRRGLPAGVPAPAGGRPDDHSRTRRGGHGFAAPLHRDFASTCSFTAAQYAAFLMTESNVIAAVEYGGKTAAMMQAWLEDELAPLFGRQPRRVAFAGYVQALRRL